MLNYIGYTLAEENRDLPRALKLLNRAIELSPDTDYMLDSLAWAYYRSGEYAKAWDFIRAGRLSACLPHPDRILQCGNIMGILPGLRI